MDIGIRKMAEPGRKEKYTFPRGCLHFLSNEKCHIPFICFPSVTPRSSSILVYSHGSSSNLNNVYEFANALALKYNVAVLAYDYTGDGESQKEFSSYEEDLKLVLAWVITEGYKLNRAILCGFSLGSYSALAL
jgi:pimeloyl-ACP methyl ester carboxylesterase